jgi:uncharacterized membrane protein
MAAEIVVTPDRFVVVRDDDTVSITSDRKKAEQIARHFKRLQPASKIVVKDTTTNNSEVL